MPKNRRKPSRQSPKQLGEGAFYVFITSFLFPETKKALQMDLESPLTHQALIRILMVLNLSVQQGPQVVPGQAPRPAKVLCLAFFSHIDKLPYFLRIHFSYSNPDKLIKKVRNSVMPAKAGIHNYLQTRDFRLRGYDAKGRFKTFYETINPLL